MFTNRNSIITLKIIGKTMIMNFIVTERSIYFCDLKKCSHCVFSIPKSTELTRTLALTCAW